jgi:hypothetical protein
MPFDLKNVQVKNNGIQGMQLHAQQIEEIKIGPINVQLSPTGTPSYVQNFGKKTLFLSHYLMLKS